MHKDQKIGRTTILFMFSSSLIFWELFIFFVLGSKAQAGGYDEPIPPSIPPLLAAPNSQLPVLSLLNWDKWENPYWLNKSICRENNGNVVCLPPQIADKFGWKISQ